MGETPKPPLEAAQGMAQTTAVFPPFRSPRGAAAFCAAVALAFALPALFSALGLYSRRDAYLEMPAGDGGFPYIVKEALDERSDVDILLLGESTLWLGVDTPYVEQALSREEGRQAKVLTYGHNWRGIDLDYALLRDTLAHRRVKLLALAVPSVEEPQDGPHHYAYHFLPYGEDPAMVAGLALQYRIGLYATSVIGAPRHLLSLARKNVEYEHFTEATRGAHLVPDGFYGAPFQPFDRDPPPMPVDSLIREKSPESFAIGTAPISDYQANFVRLIAGLLREHGVRLVTFHVPHWSWRARPVVDERVDWAQLFGGASMIGVPPARLFAGLHEEQIKLLYCNEHFNENGARLFTRAITPALLWAYHHAPQPR